MPFEPLYPLLRRAIAPLVLCLVAFTLGRYSAEPLSAYAVERADSSTPSVLHVNTAPKREVGGGKAQITLLGEGSEAFIGLLKLAAGVPVPKHRDPTEEYLYILSGSGEITINGVTHSLQKGNAVYMPAGAEVSFKNGTTPLVAFQVFAGPSSAEKYQAWTPSPR